MRPGRPSSFQGTWARLREACGGTDKLAEALGTTPHVVRSWALHSQGPSGPSRVAIAALAEKMGVPNPLLESAAPKQADSEVLERWMFSINGGE